MQVMRHQVVPLVHEGAGQGVAHLVGQETVAEIMDGLIGEAQGVLAALGVDSSQGGLT